MEDKLNKPEVEWLRRITPDMLADDPFHPSMVEFEAGMSPAPFFAISLIAVNVLVFIWELRVGALKSKDAIINAGAIYGPKFMEGEYWRLATGIFMHGGWGHLVGNCVSLYILGLAVQQAWGPARSLAIYLVSGLAGAASTVWLQPKPSVGASGAIFGLMGAAIVFFYRYQASFKPRDRRIGTVLLAWAGLQILLGMLTPYVDNCAHLGGLAAGALIGGLVPATLFARQKHN
jgi:rhomboid protease GluP